MKRRFFKWTLPLFCLLTLTGLIFASTSVAQLANTQIVFSSGRDGSWDIYVMNTDGANPIRLTNDPSDDDMPAWSPNGTKIAFRSGRDLTFEIYVVNPDGSGIKNLTKSPGFQEWNPSWSPDGTQIVFVAGDEIFVTDAKGRKVIQLTNHPAKDWWPAWSPVPSLTVSPKGKSVMTWGRIKRNKSEVR